MSVPRGRSLILGAWRGRKSGIPKVFIESARESMPNSDIVVFYNKISKHAEHYFRVRGVRLIRYRFLKRWHGPVQTHRFLHFARYAAKHASRYDHIMTADLRDVVIQSDPFARVATPKVHFFLEPAGCIIGTDIYYAMWMRDFVDQKYQPVLAECHASCCGIVLGSASEMATYLRELTRYFRAIDLSHRKEIGADSAFHNLICHVTREVPGSIVENNRLVATMGLEPSETYRVDESGLIRLANGHAPAICHQYDRHPKIEAALDARYAIS